MQILSSFSQIRIVNFNLIVRDQNCQFYLYCHISKLSVLSLLLRLKKASLIILVPDKNAIIVTDQNCLLSLLLRLKKASLSIVFPDKKCQFYLHYQRSKLPVFILIVRDHNYQFYPYCCHRKKPVLLLLAILKNVPV